MGEGEWEPDAENWVRWARTPGHDAYWLYRDDFFDCVLPPRPGRRTLEIGCGEGRVARDLQARGHRVVALDTAITLVRHAHEEVGACLVADGAALPFPAGSFDTVVAYNVLQVVADMAGTVREAGRVLSPGGHLCIVVAHPVTDLGRFVSDEPDSPFALREAYYESRRVEDRLERDGIGVTVRGWTHSLQAYADALADGGFVIEAMREPRGKDRWKNVPMFLSLRCRA